jgi:hypothetical protein
MDLLSCSSQFDIVDMHTLLVCMGCNPLLVSLICRQSSLQATLSNDQDKEQDDNNTPILVGSKLEDADGCLYRVVGMTDLQSVLAKWPHALHLWPQPTFACYSTT